MAVTGSIDEVDAVVGGCVSPARGRLPQVALLDHLLNREVGGDLVGAHGGRGARRAANHIVLPTVLLCLVPHSQQVPVTRWLSCVRLEVEAELEVVGQLLLRRGLILVQQDGVVVAALQPPLVALHPAGGVLLLQQVPSRSRFAILVERNPVDRTLHPRIADASWHVYTRELELASSPLFWSVVGIVR